MATTTKVVNRTEAEALISPEESKEILQSVVEGSTFLRHATRLPDMATNVREYPVMDNYPMAGFVDGDTGLKMTTNMKWSKKKIHVAEIAAIVPVPDNVAADSSYDIFGQLRPRLIEAAHRVIDSAVLFGVDKPEKWPEAIYTAAKAVGNSVVATTDMYKDIFGEGGVIAKVEEAGYFPDAMIGAVSMRAKLRSLRDKNDRPLFLEDIKSTVPYTLSGMAIDFPRNGAFDASKASIITGDFTQAVFAMRQDVTFKVFDSGVISNDEGKVIFNLMQNDMQAIRMVVRLAWDVFNPLNALQPDETKRYPFAVYEPAVVGG